MAILIMAHQNKNSGNDVNFTTTQLHEQEVIKSAPFHDFLGMRACNDSPLLLPPKSADATPSASISVPSAGGRGPLSATSDLASERPVGNHLEGIPFYTPRSEISGPDINNRGVGSKQRNSDSTFMGSTRHGILQKGRDSLENLHVMKILKGGGVDRPRSSNDDELFHGVQPMRPTSTSLILQPSASNKLERPIPTCSALQYPSRGGQFVPFTHQGPANRFRDTNAGSSIISQLAADEGSRTGIKVSGTLTSINAGGGTSDKNSCAVLPSVSNPKSGTFIPDPESSTPSSRPGLASATRQMTIFYGGQAHVFDDVHPNKAHVIMALAGSNGGSWSTTYSPKLAARLNNNESHTIRSGCEAERAVNTAFQHEFCGIPSATGQNIQRFGSTDRSSMPTGENHLSTFCMLHFELETVQVMLSWHVVCRGSSWQHPNCYRDKKRSSGRRTPQ
ncbi:hypothetical protein K2173_025800 [Erythroxylum novogranatense]|uniref:Protein TIFY n=1 Tax=Erythroxylum novogranatense TaxID=1862640 RepID=A0AAV8SHU9_9ROSI|nr:hypothetical protein K2173_025800 [Erythroxylum novogranatense]